MTLTAVAEPVDRDLARELSALREQRAELAADAVAGDAVDGAQLDVIEAQIAALERELERSELAAAVLERREREASLAASEAERLRLEVESTALGFERDEVVGRAVLSAETTAGLALEAVEIDRRIEANRRARGLSHRAIESGMIVDRLTIPLRDVGLAAGLEPMRAAWRASLLERWPAPLETKATVALCSVCGHAERDAIEVALAGGDMTLRAIEELHGVSRSSLSRHRQHTSTA